jgi:phospholipase C
VVILMQENRSFDHYFGALSGVRGFGDKRGHQHFFQSTGNGQTIKPFHLNTHCLPDITHDWGPQHRSWNGGHMDGFVSAREPVNGPQIAPETMGYYMRPDLPFYFALADALTICDRYYCSVIGPTDPNRLMSMSATIDPAGSHGGPLVETLSNGRMDRFSWTTMPERLSAHGISWKVYTDPTGGGVLDNVLTYFKQYSPGSKLAMRGLQPAYPADFLADLEHGTLPQAVNFAARPRYGRPRLGAPDGGASTQCKTFQPVPVPSQPFPRQERGKRSRPSGVVRRHK